MARISRKGRLFPTIFGPNFFCECQHFCRQITTPPLSSRYMMMKTDHNIKGIFLIGYERDSSKHEADYHAKMLTSTAWLMTILEVNHTTVGIVATCSRRGPDLEPSITAEIAYYTHGTVITQNRQWKNLLRPTPSNFAITHHRQLLFLWAAFLLYSAMFSPLTPPSAKPTSRRAPD